MERRTFKFGSHWSRWARRWAQAATCAAAVGAVTGEVVVLEENGGTRRIMDAAGQVHTVMKGKIRGPERKAAAERARLTREAANRRQHETPATHGEVAP
jgi:hypothetical protein